MGYGFVESMLEPYAKNELGFTQAQVGAAFLIMAGAYVAQTPLFGHVRGIIINIFFLEKK